MIMGACHFVVKHVPLPHGSPVYAACTVIFSFSDYFFWNYLIFAKDLLRKWEANVSFRVEFNVESIASGFRTLRDLQPCPASRFLRFLAKTHDIPQNGPLWKNMEGS
jgi:hypothetical protein